MASAIRSRNLERIFLLALGAVLLYLFLQLFSVLKAKMADVPQRLSDGSMMNLNGPRPADNLAALLQKGFYYEDPQDIALIKSIAGQGFQRVTEMDNIGELNKKAFELNVSDAERSGGDSFRKRARVARLLIGFSGDDSLRFDREKSHPPALPATVDVGLGTHVISGAIQTTDKQLSSGGVLVRLQMILPQDSLYSDAVEDEGRTVYDSSSTVLKIYRLDSSNHRQLISLSAYIRTDDNGHYSFEGLPNDKAFEVLPLKPGFQFGAPKGVQDLEENAALNFIQAPHKIRLFSTRDFNNLRKEKAFIVRTPEEVTKCI